MIDYDPHDWRDHLFDLKGSMLVEIGSRVAGITGLATAIVAVHEFVMPIGNDSLVHTLVGPALSLLLVFRTNASYDRFWEGRKLWGGIVNTTRNLVRASRAFLGESPLQAELVRWAAIFPHATMHALRGGRGLGPQAEALPAEVREQVLAAQHPPLAVAARMSDVLARARKQGLLGEWSHLELDRNVGLLVDLLGACERIHKTPLPFAYVVHLRRALFLFTLSLPFALVAKFHFWTVPYCFLVAFIFFGIEEIGVEIEDPFGLDENDLPLERISETIEKNLLGLERERMPRSGGELP